MASNSDEQSLLSALTTPPVVQDGGKDAHYYGRAILENLNDLVIAVDSNGNIITFNRKAEELLGIAGKDALGKSILEVLLASSTYDAFNDVVLQSIHTRENLTRDIAIQADDGETRYLEVRSSGLFDPETKGLIGAVIVASDITARIIAHRERLEFGGIFITFVFTAASWSIMTLAALKLQWMNPTSAVFNWLMVLVFLLPVVFQKYYFDIPLSTFGLTRRNLKQSVVEGFGIAAVSIPLLLLLLSLTGAYDPTYFLKLVEDPFLLVYWSSIYFLSSFFQELVARGFMQTSFRRFFNDDRGYFSIIVASIGFAILHGHFGFQAMFVTFIAGLFLGWIFQRHENLAGVTLVHFAVGFFAVSLGAF